MFVSENLKNHLETSSSVRLESVVIAEWNLNTAENISLVGNYRNRTIATDPESEDFLYSNIPENFDPEDDGNYYTGATDADVLVEGGIKDDDVTPILFTSPKEKEKLLFSLQSCFDRFRPRSGINKARYFAGKYTHHTNIDMANRPRYYLAHKDDVFKYWTSYRTEGGFERGVANVSAGSSYYIDDAAPFVVYKNAVPANRIVVKMQTNVGTVELGGFSNANGNLEDPFFGYANQTTPSRWRVQVLKGNLWSDAVSFREDSVRSDGTPIVGPDGYVELYYGLRIPEKFAISFKHLASYSSSSVLPTSGTFGDAYFVKSSDLEVGSFYVWNGESSFNPYESFVPEYVWGLADEGVTNQTPFVKTLVNPDSFINPANKQIAYREFDYVDGIRVVVETMNKVDSTFDLIELSPRLTADISDSVEGFDVTKTASDLGISGMPVGQLLASTGSMNIFDFDEAFNENNTNSILSRYVSKNIQVKFFEKIEDVGLEDYYVPIKTLYVDGFPEANAETRDIGVSLRDLMFYFESITAPQVLVQNASVSYAVSLLLDSIGFSNYSFKRIDGKPEPVIPYFFIGPDITIAQVLQDIAISTQTAMFFDEYNNFIMMTKEYIMPEESERETDLILYGTKDFQDTGVRLNENTNPVLTNIEALSSQETEVYNDGSINYVSRYIQRSYGSLRQASLIDAEKTWSYKPVLLWEVAGEQNVRSKNDDSGSQSTYTLAAIPLNSSLVASPPEVVSHRLINNTIDLGEGIYWLSRYNGYFYSNGEIIRYDAVEYSVSGVGDLWISDVQEYQKYFASLPFNGKIYPTGLIRIYSEPNYEVVEGVTRLSNGPVAKHGREQFGTEVAYHPAGIDPYWSNNDNVKAYEMESGFIFAEGSSGYAAEDLPATVVGEPLSEIKEASSQTVANKTTRNGIIKNFLSTSFLTESETNQIYATQSGTVQSSALVVNGPSFETDQDPIDFVQYVHKDLDNKFRHFGTRMRIIGRVENNESRGQTPIGSSSYYIAQSLQPNQENNVSGASGGLAVMLNPRTHNGYFFEIVALTNNNVDSYDLAGEIHNVIFYKTSKESGSDKIIPQKLWGGFANILVDDGNFTGQYRMSGESNTTVYDLAVEYEDVAGIRRFYLYINNKVVAVVDDPEPLPTYSNMALFVRGSARCMFENIYAITNDYAKDTSSSVGTPINSIFGDSEISVNDSFNKYAISGSVQSTYLSGISPIDTPNHKIYFEEFGTIMREASYFDIRYDKAFPALYSQISPTFNKIKGYVVSGFVAGSYGAEFLVFNATDTTISLDETSGNYLRIQGVTFTQQSQHELSVDEFYSKHSSFSDPQLSNKNIIISPQKYKEDYIDIRQSRVNNGRKAFSLEAPYIQTQDDATDLMRWLMSKISKKRKSVGLSVFSMPTIQLGDLVFLRYKSNENVDQVSEESKRFVVYAVEYKRSSVGPTMNVYLSEVV